MDRDRRSKSFWRWRKGARGGRRSRSASCALWRLCFLPSRSWLALWRCVLSRQRFCAPCAVAPPLSVIHSALLILFVSAFALAQQVRGAQQGVGGSRIAIRWKGTQATQFHPLQNLQSPDPPSSGKSESRIQEKCSLVTLSSISQLFPADPRISAPYPQRTTTTQEVELDPACAAVLEAPGPWSAALEEGAPPPTHCPAPPRVNCKRDPAPAPAPAPALSRLFSPEVSGALLRAATDLRCAMRHSVSRECVGPSDSGASLFQFLRN